MSSLSLEQKLAQYHDFFAIEHQFSVNIMPIDNNEAHSFDQFIASIPMPFKLATDMSAIDQSALRSLQNLGSSATQLVNFLNQQSQKIDLLIGYILSQQDEVQHRYKGLEFGGGGIKFITEQAFKVGQLLEVKIFLLDSHCAMYCYGEVVDVILTNEQFVHKVIFHFIREEDREVLVRTSLHQQAKQLQKLAKQRDQESKSNAALDK
ncbi:PilZ domain-containing protein [Colwellia ponticola]|uniref:PilZ domain-containing protein n=1 Tax=Colwellia ponticola TaxID=2304625 RepID=A0A8H2PLP0_9GAMM|nr:PilZ domain-containing protein [Colwellia ponticola]TMM42621.1 PilZ domain-containing protein [Colwellia ponticola]